MPFIFSRNLKIKLFAAHTHTHTMLVSAVSVHVCFAFDSLPNKHFSIFPFLHLIQRYLDIRIQWKAFRRTSTTNNEYRFIRMRFTCSIVMIFCIFTKRGEQAKCKSKTFSIERSRLRMRNVNCCARCQQWLMTPNQIFIWKMRNRKNPVAYTKRKRDSDSLYFI